MNNTLQSIPWARRLKFRHLEVFIALQENGSLTAAALQLHMTQPALSHWLADMEEAVGCTLFDRARKFALTSEGVVLHAHAARMLGDIQRTHLDLLAVQSGLAGRVHVGTGLPRVLLPNTIGRMQQSHIGCFVSVTESPLPELLDLLARREIDVVIGALSAQALASGFTCEPLLADSVQIAVCTGHPLLQQTKSEWHETLAYPWLLPPTGSVMRGALETAFTAQGLQAPVPVVEANSSIRMQLLSGEQPYVSILSRAELQIYRPLGSLKIVQLNPVIALPDIGAIWDSARFTPLLSRFLDALRLESREQASWT